MSRDTIVRAYQALSDATPLRFDCGLLCGSRCCGNNMTGSAKAGMYLLPHEEEILKGQKGFRVTGDRDRVLLCGGECDREYRPFACRIFPFYASVSLLPGKIRFRILPDPRASGLCPILDRRYRPRARAGFFRAIKRALRILAADSEILADLVKTSDFLKEIELLREKLSSDYAFSSRRLSGFDHLPDPASCRANISRRDFDSRRGRASRRRF